MSHPAPTVLVLGARGRFGHAAVLAFARAGWRVVAQMREGAVAPHSPVPGVQWLAHSLDDCAGVAAAAEGASVVVHALNPNAYTDAAWQVEVPALLDRAMRIAQALSASLMAPGNVYNFGSDMPANLREDTPQRATSVKGQVRVAMEQRLVDAARHGALRSIVIRAGNFFGNGKGSWFDQVTVKDIARGRVTWAGSLDVPGAWAYLPDLADTFVQVAQQREKLPAFESLHFAGHTLTGQQWLDVLTAVTAGQGRALRIAQLPWGLLRVFGLFNAKFASLAALRYLWQVPHQLDNTRLRALIGPEPHTLLADAAHAALASLGLTQSPISPSPSAGIKAAVTPTPT